MPTPLLHESHSPSNDSPSRSELLDEIIAQYLRASESGQNPSREELLARHPELATGLREFFADRDRMKLLAQPLWEKTCINPVTPAAERIRYFGDYEVLEEIARGGMGVVFKARQVTLNRIVAIKMILSGQLASPADVERFHTEAQAAAKLDHPGIVPIHEVGQHDGQHYFSMGFVDGQSLAARLAQGPMPERESVELVATVCAAVQYANEQGVIHRDLKPGNILLDHQGRPRVTDFGLAKLTGNDSDLTGTGQILGTPSYMPPEQAAARRDPIGPAADVYSLGAILYCLLTGRPPFQAATPVETLLQVQQQEPIPPQQLNPTISLDLGTIVLKCLEKSPARRYDSAKSLAEELTCYLENRPILARRVGRGERLRRWWQDEPLVAANGAVQTKFSRKLKVAGIVAALLLILAGLGFYEPGKPGADPAENGQTGPTPRETIPATAPLTGNLEITVWTDPGKSGRQVVSTRTKSGLPINLLVPGALPVQNGELVHVHVSLNRPAYVYLVWIDSNGATIPLYPWDADHSKSPWEDPIPKQASAPTDNVHCPSASNRGFRAVGDAGMQHVVLLARSTPLADPLGTLQTALKDLPPSPLSSTSEVAYLEWSPNDGSRIAQLRGFAPGESKEFDAPVFNVLKERLQDEFELIKVWRFAQVEE